MFHLKSGFLLAAFFLFEFVSVHCEPPKIDTSLMLSYASDELDSICTQLVESQIKLMWLSPPDVEIDTNHVIETLGLKIKDFRYLRVNDIPYAICQIGCVTRTEIVLIDSAQQNVEKLRIKMGIPDLYSNFGKFLDVNKDGIPELEIHCSSGSHPMYLSLLSIYPDSLAFIKNDRDDYLFMASGGAARTIDIDSDGIYEISCSNKQWPGESPHEPTIYRWDGKVYRPDVK